MLNTLKILTVFGLSLLYPELASGATTQYAYDAFGRLLVADTDGTQIATTAYVYDNAGNREKVNASVALPGETRIFLFTKSNQKHFYTPLPMEGYQGGLTFQGLEFSLFSQPGASLVPVYRCYIPEWNDHFISFDAGCEGASAEGPLGYVQAVSDSSVRPLYRFFKSSLQDHLITPNYDAAIAAGYSFEGQMGWVR